MKEAYEEKANEGFEDAVESYRKETKTNARKATIVTTIFIAVFFIFQLNPYQKFKDYRSLKNLNTSVTNYYTALADNNYSVTVIVPNIEGWYSHI